MIKNMEESIITEKLLSASLWDRLGRWSLYLLGFLVPLWVLPFTSNPLATNKVALSYSLITVAFLCWLIARINGGKVFLPKNYLALSLVLMAFVWFLSGIFSISPSSSFFKLSDDPLSFFAVLMFILAGLTAYFYLRSPEHIFFWFSAVFASAFLIFITQFLRLIFGLNAFVWVNFPSAASNVFGSWSELGMFFSLALALSIFLFEILAERKLKITFLALSVVSFAMLILVSNFIIWWTTFAFLLIITAYLLSLKPRKVNIFRAPFFALLLVLLFIQVPALSSFVTSYFGADAIEIRPSWPASWSVVQKTLEESPVLGSGPATFVYDWLRFKPLAVNESIFWATRFSSGSAFALTLLASVGILGFLAFFFVLASFLYYAFKALVGAGEARLDPIFVLVLLGALMILTYLLIYNPGFTLVMFFFLLLGMFTALISGRGITKEYDITLFQSSGTGFISSLAIIFLLIVSFSGFYVFGQKYLSAYFFGKAATLSAAGDIGGGRVFLDRTVSFDRRDTYFRAATELDLGQISLLLSRTDLPAEDLRASFQNLLSRAIQNAQTSTSLNPVDSLNWVSLGRVYEAVIPFQIQGAANFSSAAYVEAARRNPTSPELILFQARVALASNDLSAAKELLENSLKLKNNYTPAHFLLAQIEDAQGNIGAAILRSEAAVILSPNDIGALFQLGLLYYREDRLNNARAFFEKAVALNPNYSNARYFLGLIYDRLGDKDSAIEQFERVSALNPQNQEVERILNNLHSGKSALSGITPPPEERNEPPVKE